MSLIRLGVCAPLEAASRLAALGCDYLEGNLSEIALLTDAAFRARLEAVRESGLSVEVMGGMLPRELNVTGRGVNAAELHGYLDFAFRRARMLGAQVVVLASACARQVTESFPMDVAWRQFSNFLRLVERHATDHDLIVAIEPLCRMECNLLSTVSEATLLCSIMQLKHIRIAANTYHMAMEHEPLGNLVQAGSLLAHVYTCNALSRSMPSPEDGEDYRALFWALSAAGYRGRVGVEAGFDDLEKEAGTAIRVLRAAINTL